MRARNRMTDRDLSTSIAELRENCENSDRQLEDYLLAFWFLASQYKHQAAIAANQFIELLRLAFTMEIPAFQDEWRSKKFNLYSDEEDSYLAFEGMILEQIVDLREMDEAGSLSSELRYFGLDSPRGNCWYNFDSLAYLECAVAGFDDDWEEAENIDTVLNKKASIDSHSFTQDRISWSKIRDFFYCGRIYE